MKSRRVLFLASLPGTLALATHALGQATYYVSPNGNDSNNGLTPATAWASVGKVDNTTFTPGSQILFQTGGNWYDQLIASSSGTTANPIVYGSYGVGAQPTFWGSDLVGPSSFQSVAGAANTYTYHTSTLVNTFLIDHQFAHSAALVSGKSTAADNISYVKTTPDSWYYDTTGGQLYVNTGAPLSTSHTYGVATRMGLVENNGQSNVTFQNLAVKESASPDWGYAFYANFGSNVQFLNDTAVAAGKHAFVAINTQNFLGQNLKASYLMPDLGFGGATGFVSYSDSRMTTAGTPSSYSWVNDSFTNANGPYLGFYSHGDPGAISSILLQNLYSNSQPGSAVAAVDANEKITILGGRLDGGGNFDISATNALISGVTFNGGYLTVTGDNNIVQNSIFSGDVPNWGGGHDGAIVVNGHNNIVRFNTVDLGAATTYGGAAIGLEIPGTNTQLYGNIINSPYGAFFLKGFTGNPGINSSHNLFAGANNNNPYIFDSAGGMQISISQWEAMGYDVASIFANPQFADAANGNYTLLSGSPALGVFNPTTGQLVATDFFGDSRATFTSLGAIEPSLAVAGSTTLSASSDASIGAAGAGVALSGGTLSITNSFATTRTLTITGAGGTISVAAGQTFSAGMPWLVWAGGNLNVGGSGTVAFAQTTGVVSVMPGSSINIAASASVVAGGNYDPFTDSFITANHVAIVNNGSFTVNINSAIGRLTGAGALIVGNGSTKNTLQLASQSGSAAMASLKLNTGAALDITDNTVNINYGAAANPAATIRGYLAASYNAGAWNMAGIFSSLADNLHGIGYVDNKTGNLKLALTYYGDANLDGSVGFSDLVTVAQDYNKTGMTWSGGDFNYDGTVNFNDLIMVTQDYSKSLLPSQMQELQSASPAFATDWNLAMSEVTSVPEPTGLAGLALCSLLLRRARRNKIAQ